MKSKAFDAEKTWMDGFLAAKMDTLRVHLYEGVDSNQYTHIHPRLSAYLIGMVEEHMRKLGMIVKPMPDEVCAKVSALTWRQAP